MANGIKLEQEFNPQQDFPETPHQAAVQIRRSLEWLQYRAELEGFMELTHSLAVSIEAAEKEEERAQQR